MARKAALYTVVFVDDGQIEIATYGDDLEAAGNGGAEAVPLPPAPAPRTKPTTPEA